jgi:ABC-type transport system involved in cytochrome c biogenesis permease component
MVIPSVIVSILYAYNVFQMRTLALDATVVIAITFLGSTIAATISNSGNLYQYCLLLPEGCFPLQIPVLLF